MGKKKKVSFFLFFKREKKEIRINKIREEKRIKSEERCRWFLIMIIRMIVRHLLKQMKMLS